MLYDLLHRWPLELITFWVFPLFFAFKFIHLGLLGVYGRGIPVLNSKRRWQGSLGQVAAFLFLLAGSVICFGFMYWLTMITAVRFFGLSILTFHREAAVEYVGSTGDSEVFLFKLRF